MGSTDKTPLGINLLSIGLPVEPSLLSGSIPILFYYQHHCLPPDSSSDSATKPNNKGVILYLFTYIIINGNLVGVTVYIPSKPCFHKSWGFHMYMWRTNWLSFGYRYINKNTFNQFINSFTWRDPLVAQMAENLPAMQETQVQCLGWEDPLGMATHSSILAWRISWTEESGGLQSMSLQRVRHDWLTNTHTAIDSTILKYWKHME